MVSVIACTIRDYLIDNVFDNFLRQDVDDKELIIILNNDQMDMKKWEEKAEQYLNIKIYRIPENKTLGDCMNFGIEKASYDIVAKFDDDDYYSPFYLSEAVDIFNEHEDIQLVGKGVSFLYFEEQNLLALYRQGKESKAGDSFIKGGTLVFKKELYPTIKFPSQKAGSDSEFRKACKRNNVKMYTTSRYNYVCTRRSNLNTHTYQLPADEFLKNCEVIANVEDFSELVSKRMM